MTGKLLHISCNILMMILLTFVLCFSAFQETLGVLVSSRVNGFIFFLSFQDEGPCCLKGKLFLISCNIFIMILLAFVLCFSAFQGTLGVQVSSRVTASYFFALHALALFFRDSLRYLSRTVFLQLA